MQFEALLTNSTAIRAIAFNQESEVIRILFRSGKGYEYACNRVKFENMAQAESVGKAYNQEFPRGTEFIKLNNDQTNTFLMNL